MAGSLCPALVSADGQLRDAAAALDSDCWAPVEVGDYESEGLPAALGRGNSDSGKRRIT